MAEHAMTLVFRPHTEAPTQPDGALYRQAILYNPCDGYHVVFARFDVDDGEFEGFFDWIGDEPYKPGEFFDAWAILPDCNETLWPVFAKKAEATA